jgi:DNA-binding NarL/FixJ family response regulator
MASKVHKATRTARVLVVDDHPLVRYALTQLLDKDPGFKCCGDADCLDSARKAVGKLLPDLVFLDLTLGEDDAFVLIREWKEALPAMKVLVISRHDEPIYAERALHCGADGFVTKAEPPGGDHAVRGRGHGGRAVRQREAFGDGLEAPWWG